MDSSDEYEYESDQFGGFCAGSTDGRLPRPPAVEASVEIAETVPDVVSQKLASGQTHRKQSMQHRSVAPCSLTGNAGAFAGAVAACKLCHIEVDNNTAGVGSLGALGTAGSSAAVVFRPRKCGTRDHIYFPSEDPVKLSSPPMAPSLPVHTSAASSAAIGGSNRGAWGGELYISHGAKRSRAANGRQSSNNRPKAKRPRQGKNSRRVSSDESESYSYSSDSDVEEICGSDSNSESWRGSDSSSYSNEDDSAASQSSERYCHSSASVSTTSSSIGESCARTKRRQRLQQSRSHKGAPHSSDVRHAASPPGAHKGVKFMTTEQLQAARAERLHQLLARTEEIQAQLSSRIQTLTASQRLASSSAASFSCDAVGGADHASCSDSSVGAVEPLVAASNHALRHQQQPRSIVGAALWEYQLSGLRFLLSLHEANLNGILADEMGLGKTLQVLAFLAHLLEARRSAGPHLVVAPLSVLDNWRCDAARFMAPELAQRLHVHHGGSDARERRVRLGDFMRRVRGEAAAEREAAAGVEQEGTALRRGGFCIVVTSYELVLRDLAPLRRHAWQYLVVDEGHRLKNPRSKLGAALRLLPSRHRLLLTGTPLQNDLGELWTLLNFCLPALFDSQEHFSEWFAAPFAHVAVAPPGGSGESAAGAPALLTASAQSLALSSEEEAAIVRRLHAILRPFLLRRLKADVLAQLPRKTEVLLRCPMSAQQAALYERARAGVRGYIDPATGALAGSASLTNLALRLRQICCHPVLLADTWRADADLVRASGKFEALHRLLPRLVAAGHRVLLFSQWASVLDLLQDLCDMCGLRAARLDGGVDRGARAAALAAFNDPARAADLHVFLLTTRAGGVGINLQAADTVVIFDSDWNPQADLQAMSRAHRIGQTKDVLVLRLLSRGVPVPQPHQPTPLHDARKEGRASAAASAVAAAAATAAASPQPPQPPRYRRSVEELMHDRTRLKLRTEAVVIGRGRFLHGTATTSGAADASSAAHAGRSGPSKEALALLLLQAAGDDAEAGEEAEAACGGGGGGAAQAGTDHRLSAGAARSAARGPTRYSRASFDALSDAELNRVCARDEGDLRAFEAWGAHLQSFLAAGRRQQHQHQQARSSSAAVAALGSLAADSEDEQPTATDEWEYFFPLSLPCSCGDSNIADNANVCCPVKFRDQWLARNPLTNSANPPCVASAAAHSSVLQNLSPPRLAPVAASTWSAAREPAEQLTPAERSLHAIASRAAPRAAPAAGAAAESLARKLPSSLPSSSPPPSLSRLSASGCGTARWLSPSSAAPVSDSAYGVPPAFSTVADLPKGSPNRVTRARVAADAFKGHGDSAARPPGLAGPLPAGLCGAEGVRRPANAVAVTEIPHSGSAVTSMHSAGLHSTPYVPRPRLMALHELPPDLRSILIEHGLSCSRTT